MVKPGKIHSNVPMLADIPGTVSRHPYFAALPARVRAEAARTARLHRFKAGQYVWHSGERVERYCLLVDGLLKTSVPLPDGKNAILEIFKPGDLCGCLVQLLSGKAVCNLRAITDSSVICIPARVIDNNDPHNAGWYAAVARGLARRFQELINLRVISSLKSRRRIPALLLWLDRRTGGDIPLTQGALAMIAGVTEETVCRSLAPLKLKGIIGLSRGKVAITDRDTLKRLCEEA